MMTNLEKKGAAKLKQAQALVQKTKELGAKTLLWPEGALDTALEQIADAISYLECYAEKEEQ